LATGTSTEDNANNLLNRTPQSSVGRTPNLLDRSRYYAPTSLSLLPKLGQTAIIRRGEIEVDSVVFQNLKHDYHKSLYPLDRLILQLPFATKMNKWLRGFSSWITLCSWYSEITLSLWIWICPMIRNVSIWDLKDVQEAKVSQV
jgi:hypothetical protein